MSRIGRRPVAIPKGVTVDKIDGELRVKGPKGTLARAAAARRSRSQVEGGEVVFARADDDGRRARCTASRARWSRTWCRA